MSRKKLSPLIEAINNYNQLDERDRLLFSDYVRSQQPRRVAQPQKREKKADKPAICGVCGYEAEHTNHDMTYISSHPFAGPGTAPSVGRRSRRQSTPTTSTPNTEADSASVMTASGD